jgi:ADP-ribose pyrophosphatase
VELPAGTCEVGESTEATAHRELIEETGFRAERLTPLQTFFMSPGILDEAMHLFLAEGLIPGGASPEPGEEIENLIVSWPEAMAMIRNGQIEDAKTLVGLLYFDRFRAGP